MLQILSLANFIEVVKMKNAFFKARALLLAVILSAFPLLSTVIHAEALNTESENLAEVFSEAVEAVNLSDNENIKVGSRFFDLIFGKKENKEKLKLCPSGDVFGIHIKEDGVVVCHSESDVIHTGDRIIRIGGKDTLECEDIYEAVRESGGAPLKITLVRGGEEMTLTATPKYTGSEYKLGITLRSQSAGIGTVTFIDPTTLSFGGLGHAVSDSETGDPVSVRSGSACRVTLGACKKGVAGKAGELSGVLSKSTIGKIFKNTECGVFGQLNSMPTTISEPLPVAEKSEVKAGPAEIISTIKNGKTAYYKVEITDIDYTSEGSKSFKIKVTDPTLISLTGGIVRGMSGSPIIQNGKLVGAVTHVLIADPTEGYGIFIENMLSAAQSEATPKAA